jgi:hypothetical protein
VGHDLVKFLRANAEDLFLAAGALLVSVGVGLAFGLAFGLIAAGVLFLAYGVWITQGGVA